MRVFFIPVPVAHPSNERTYALWSALAARYEVIGIPRKFFFGKRMEKPRVFYYGLIPNFLVYSLRVFVDAFHKRKLVNLIFCEDVWYGLLGILLSFAIRKPVVCDVRENLYRTYQIDQHSPLMLGIWLCLERLAWHFCPLITTGSDLHKKAYSSQGIDTSKILTVPLSVDLNLVAGTTDKVKASKYFGFDPEKKRLLCVGDRRYAPNWEAALWVNDSLAPALSNLSTPTEIVFGSPGQVPRNISSNVRFMGNVKDFPKLLSTVDIAIVPNWRVNGVLTRLLDFMASNKPVIVTKQAAMWVPGLVDDVNALICRDKDEFKKKTIWALQHLDLLQPIADNARALIEERYNWDKMKLLLYKALEDVNHQLN